MELLQNARFKVNFLSFFHGLVIFMDWLFSMDWLSSWTGYSHGLVIFNGLIIGYRYNEASRH